MRLKWIILPLLIMPIVAVGLLFYFRSQAPQETKIYGAVPSFEFVDQKGSKVGLGDLKGKTWVANFVFTSCSGQCPLLNQKFKTLQERFHQYSNFRLVSFSVDPTRDTPKVLNKYSERFGAQPQRWHFLTTQEGKKGRQTMKNLLDKGFLVMGGWDDTGEGIITHSFKFVLVDQWGRIRGYFDGDDSASVRKLERKVKKLLTERT